MISLLINDLTSKIQPIDIIESNYDQTYILKQQDSFICSVVFWTTGLIECKIESEHTSYYYLHFESQDYYMAKKLLDDFLVFYDDFFNQETKHVLICCSSGFTSSLLVDGINRIIKEMNYRIHLDYGSCFHQEDINHYHMILLAPQIGYMKHQMKENNVDVIPTNIYASNNYHSLLTYIINHIFI